MALRTHLPHSLLADGQRIVVLSRYVAEKAVYVRSGLVNQGRAILRVGQQGSGGILSQSVCRSLVPRPDIIFEFNFETKFVEKNVR